MRKLDVGIIATKVFSAGVCAVTGWLLWIVAATIARDVGDGDWAGLPILLVGLLLFGAPFAFGAYVLVFPYLPRPKPTKANPAWVTEHLRALPFVTTAVATARQGTWRITVESQPLTPAQTSTLLNTVWIESSFVPAAVVLNGRSTGHAELTALFGEHPLSG